MTEEHRRQIPKGDQVPKRPASGGLLRWDLKPETYKKYPQAPRTALPPP